MDVFCKTYRVVWEHVDGHISKSVDIAVYSNSDGVNEAMQALVKFQSFFFAGEPPIVKRIIKLEVRDGTP